MFWTSDEDKTFNLEEICELCGVELSDADRVAFLLLVREERAEVFDDWEVGCWL